MPDASRGRSAPHRVGDDIRVRSAADVVAVLGGERLRLLSLATRQPILATPSVMAVLEVCADWTPIGDVPVDGGGVEYLLHLGILERDGGVETTTGPRPLPGDESQRTDVVRCGAREYPLYRHLPTSASDGDRSEFDRCFEVAASRGPGHPIVLDSRLARHEFLAHLARHRNVLFHGSNRMDLSVLQPARRSVDRTPHGNRAGVYSTADGLVAMFLAHVDRARYRGVVGIEWISFPGEDGSEQRGYRFSIGEHWLTLQPWTPGAVYILPNEYFERCRRADGELVDEWISQTPVRPIAVLPVRPEDFPMLRHIAGHDDEPFRRLLELDKELFARSVVTEELPDGYRQQHTSNEELVTTILEWAALRRAVEPSGRIELVFEPFGGPVLLRVRGPNALKEVRRDLLRTGVLP
jgi:hypothetical protein